MLAALTAGAALVGCAAQGPAKEDVAVCDALQSVLDRLVAGESEAALAQLDDLRDRVEATKNTTLETAGRQFFRAIGTRVEDRSKLTLQETVDLGKAVREEGAGWLETMVTECDRLGQPVQRSDQ